MTSVQTSADEQKAFSRGAAVLALGLLFGCRAPTGSVDPMEPRPVQPSVRGMPLDDSVAEVVAVVGDDVITEDEVAEYLASFEAVTDRNEAIDRLVEASLFRQHCGLREQDAGPRQVNRVFDGPRQGTIAGHSETPLMRELVQAHRCESDLLAVDRLRDYSGDELRTYYARHPDRYASDEPWFEFVSVVVEMDDVGGPVGVPECDRHLALRARCILEYMPAATREHAMQVLRSLAEKWREAEGSEKRELPAICREASLAAKRATEPMGCEWDDGSVDLAFIRQDSKKRIRELHASVRKSGATAETAIRRLQLRPDERIEDAKAVSGAKLDRPVRDALGPLREGQLSDPFELEGTHRFVLLTRRGPAGPIPFDVVTDEVAADLRQDETYRRQRVLGELRERFGVRQGPR